MKKIYKYTVILFLLSYLGGCSSSNALNGFKDSFKEPVANSPQAVVYGNKNSPLKIPRTPLPGFALISQINAKSTYSWSKGGGSKWHIPVGNVEIEAQAYTSARTMAYTTLKFNAEKNKVYIVSLDGNVNNVTFNIKEEGKEKIIISGNSKVRPAPEVNFKLPILLPVK